MEERLDAAKAAPAGYKAMQQMQGYVNASGLDASLLELVKIRASQINGCAFCLQLHAREARKAGETEERVWLLDAWREAPVYTPRERAALEWTEAVTNVTDGHVPDEVYDLARRHFDAKELVDLTLAITTINAWNRLSIAFRRLPAP